MPLPGRVLAVELNIRKLQRLSDSVENKHELFTA
jgi:hypothetical protein